MSALLAILKMKCPCCRKGNMFSQPSVFPLTGMLNMPKRCPVCTQKMELEPGFYFGTGYVSYALSIAVMTAVAVAFAVLWGFSIHDNSAFWYLGIAIGITLLLQPWLMRWSRVLYLYMFVRFGKLKEHR